MTCAWISAPTRACRSRPARLGWAALSALAWLTGCEGRGGRDESAIRRELQQKGSVEVLRQAERATFVPPADGHLTSRQVELYLAVRRRARDYRMAALANLKQTGREAKADSGSGGKAALLGTLQAAGDLEDVATAALRAAQELKVNPKEYRWAAKQVEEARFTGATQGLQEKVAASRIKILEALEERAKRTTDPAKRRELEEEISTLRRRTEALGRGPSEAARFNAALLARYAEPLAALRREEMEFYADRLGLRAKPKRGDQGGELGDEK